MIGCNITDKNIRGCEDHGRGNAAYYDVQLRTRQDDIRKSDR